MSENYRTLKRRADELSQEVSKMEGVRENLLEQLARDFGCHSIEDAEAELKKLEKLEVQRKRKAERLLEDFEKEWADELAEED